MRPAPDRRPARRSAGPGCRARRCVGGRSARDVVQHVCWVGVGREFAASDAAGDDGQDDGMPGPCFAEMQVGVGGVTLCRVDERQHGSGCRPSRQCVRKAGGKVDQIAAQGAGVRVGGWAQGGVERVEYEGGLVLPLPVVPVGVWVSLVLRCRSDRSVVRRRPTTSVVACRRPAAELRAAWTREVPLTR
jgi:hypothetical protein